MLGRDVFCNQWRASSQDKKNATATSRENLGSWFGRLTAWNSIFMTFQFQKNEAIKCTTEDKSLEETGVVSTVSTYRLPNLPFPQDLPWVESPAQSSSLTSLSPKVHPWAGSSAPVCPVWQTGHRELPVCFLVQEDLLMKDSHRSPCH